MIEQTYRTWLIKSGLWAWLLSAFLLANGLTFGLGGGGAPVWVATLLFVASAILFPPITALLRVNFPIFRNKFAPLVVVAVLVIPAWIAGAEHVGTGETVQVVSNQTVEDDPEERASWDAVFVDHTISKALVDPESARFTNVMAYRTGPKKVAFCGEVNAKNRMGGYTGPQPFVIADSGILVGEAATAEIILAECQGASAAPISVR